jgi:hypothetical protein
MNYQKPIIVDLNAATRAVGHRPLACLNGDNPWLPGAIPSDCGTGGIPLFPVNCQAGDTNEGCASGSNAGFTCTSGPSPNLGIECSAGTGGNAGDCTAGPSFI